MNFVFGRDASLQRKTLQHARKQRIVARRQADPHSAGCESKDGGAIAALSRNGDVVATPEAPKEARALCRPRPLGHGDDVIYVRIACDNASRIGKREYVDFRSGPCAMQAANQWRRQQQIAKTT